MNCFKCPFLRDTSLVTDDTEELDYECWLDGKVPDGEGCHRTNKWICAQNAKKIVHDKQDTESKAYEYAYNECLKRKEQEMPIFINPGSGPVNGDIKNATANIAKFMEDLGLQGLRKRHLASLDRNGRFGYRLYYEGKHSDIEMPGLPLDKVRYVDSVTQNIWNFPRLYIDGSSWVWAFATGCAISALTGREE